MYIKSLVLILPLTLFSAQEDAARQADELVKKLRSDDVKERVEASRSLRTLGIVAVPALTKASKDKDPEVAQRAGRLLRVLDLRIKLPAALMAAMPGLEDRLALGDNHAWTEVFFKIIHERGRKLDFGGTQVFYFPPSKGKKDDLEVAAVPAIRGAKTADERAETCRYVGFWDLKSAIPELFKRLKDSEGLVRANAAGALGSLGCQDAIKEVTRLLEDPYDKARIQAIQSLAELGAHHAVPGIRKRLREGDTGERFVAAAALVKLGAKEAVPDLRLLLKDKDSWCRQTAVESLLEFDAVEATADIIPLLGDPSSDVRQAACKTLADFDAGSAIPAMVRLLDKPGLHVWAIDAIGKLRARKAAPVVVTLLSVQDTNVRAAAARALGELGDPSATSELVKRLRDENASVRAWAASSLCRLGSRKGVATLLGSFNNRTGSITFPGGSLFSLNALCRPNLWSRLRQAPLQVARPAKRKDVAEALARQQTIDITVPPDVIESPWSDGPEELCRRGNTSTWLRTLEHLVDSAGYPVEAILEGDRVRIVDREEALEFWRAWWNERTERKGSCTGSGIKSKENPPHSSRAFK